jgi:hypothetical protein
VSESESVRFPAAVRSGGRARLSRPKWKWKAQVYVHSPNRFNSLSVDGLSSLCSPSRYCSCRRPETHCKSYSRPA